MDIIFTDEQEASVDGDKFILAIAFRIPATEIEPLRKKAYLRLTDILDLDQVTEVGRKLERFPLLHGSDLLRGFPDAKRIEALSALFGLVCETNASFFRIGYFLNSCPDGFAPNERKKFCLSAASFGVWARLWVDDADPAIVVSEFDREDLKRNFVSSTDNISLYYRISQDSLSLPIDKMIWHYFAKKEELGCQIADLAAYVALKSMKRNPSEFQLSLGKIYDQIAHLFEVDRIIWWNDDARSRIRK